MKFTEKQLEKIINSKNVRVWIKEEKKNKIIVSTNKGTIKRLNFTSKQFEQLISEIKKHNKNIIAHKKIYKSKQKRSNMTAEQSFSHIVKESKGKTSVQEVLPIGKVYENNIRQELGISTKLYKEYDEIFKKQGVNDSMLRKILINNRHTSLRARFVFDIVLINQRGKIIATMTMYGILLEEFERSMEYWIGKLIDSQSFEELKSEYKNKFNLRQVDGTLNMLNDYKSLEDKICFGYLNTNMQEGGKYGFSFA